MSIQTKGILVVTCLFIFAGISYACYLTPIANIDTDPNSRCLGETVTLDASGSYDPDGGSITAYIWVFPEEAYDISGSRTVQPSCKFRTSGTYEIKLKVRDDEDDWSVEYDACTVTVVQVQSLLPDMGAEIEDNDPNTRTFVVCTAASGDVTVTAAPNPTVTEANLPVCWSMTGGGGSGQLSRTVSLTSTGSTTISVTTCGTSNASTIIDVSADTDSDGMPDNWETHYGLNSSDPNDAALGIDTDGLTNLEEYQAGTNPDDNDTDNDGMNDGWELDNYLDPLNASDNDLDLDGDGYTNLCEYLHVSDPNDLVSEPSSNITIDVPSDVSVIQFAINASINGDIIEIAQGTYYEAIDLLGRSITIQGSDPDDWEVVEATIIDANDLGPAVTFAGTEDPNCHLTGITITGGLAGQRDGLVAYWDMNEGTGSTAFDGSGNSHDGTLTGGPVWDSSGYYGSALDFDGQDDYVQITGYKGVLGSSSRTCAAWIKAVNTASALYAIMSWGNDNVGSRWEIALNSSTAGTLGAVRLLAAGGTIIGSTDLRDSEWHHVAVVLPDNSIADASEALIYVDGLLEINSYSYGCAINTGDTTGDVAQNDVFIGRHYLSAPYENYFDGLIDEVRIYDRGLTEREISELADQGEMVAHWRLDETSGSTAYDSFDSLDGTLTNFSGTDSEWQRGVYAGALDFDGTDDYVLGSTSPFGFTNTTFTASAWFKKLDSATGIIVSEGGAHSGWLLATLSTGQIKVQLKISNGYDAYTAITTDAYDDGQWHYVAAVITTDTTGSSGNNADVYVNGNFVGVTHDRIGAYGASSTGWTIGTRDAGYSHFFKGPIDDVRIYQTALTETEIRNIYLTGGGIMGKGATAEISKCIITENFSVNDGGGISFFDGTISRCMITKNISESSGGGLSNCNATIINCVIAGNSSMSGGGLAYCNNIIENCTIANNLAYRGGGLYDCSLASSILNTIIWANWADQDEQMYNSPDPDYSCIQDWTGSGTGNITDNPLFIDLNNFDYHLDPNSLCIDAGYPYSIFSNEPWPNYFRINIGAYGNTSEAAMTIDSDNDGLSNPDEVRNGTGIFDWDSDDDGLGDGIELEYYRSDPLNSDTDDDNMPDGWEVVNGLNPTYFGDRDDDEDNDSLDSLGEYNSNTNPNNYDSDGDGMPDGWEDYYGLVPTDPNDADNDLDNDNYSNVAEYFHGMDPNNTDTTVPPITITVPTDIANIQTALDWSIDGDIIEVLPGTYQEVFDFKGKAVTVRSSDPNDWDIVKATVIDANSLSSAVTFESGEDANSVLCGFTIRNATYGISCSNSSAPSIGQCLILDNDHGVYCSNSAALITCNKIADNTSSGIYTSGSSGPAIRNNWLYGNGYAVYLGGATSAGTICNNTLVNNNYGIYLDSGTAPDIVNCIVWNSTTNDLYSCNATYSCIEDGDAGTGNISSDPNFVDATDPNEPDYHLNPVSPCINAGDPNGTYSGLTDIDGKARVHGLKVDMGADEIPVTWYVDIDASGTGDGASWQNAFNIIQDAIELALDADTIIVAEGTYNESIDFLGKAVTVTGTDPDDWEVIAGTVVDSNDVTAAVSFTSGEGNDSILEGLTITGDGKGIYCSNASPTLLNCILSNNKSFGLYCYSGSPVISDCRIVDNDNYGLRFYKSSGTLENCVVAGNAVGGISGGLLAITSCTIAYNDGYGIYSSSGLVSNCVIWGNANDLYASSATYSCIGDGDAGAGNISYMPYFEDPNTGDYHLLSYSPCIDMGDPNSDYSEESSGGGGRINMGAYGNTADAQLKSADSDNDGLPDTWELLFWSGDDPNTHDPTDDPDSDTLNNLIEYQIGTDPTDDDVDNDGLSDGWEYENGFAWFDDDIDDDGMPDGWEYNNSLDAQDGIDAQQDTDADGLTNLQEYNAGTNPNNPDSDDDGMQDGWENSYGMVPTDPNDGASDDDLDGFTNVVEYIHGSDPNDPNSLCIATIITVPTEVGTIQKAIDWSIGGDIIEVLPDTYNEAIDFEGKAVTLRSTDPQDWDVVASTVIDGGNDPNEAGYPQSSGVIVMFSSGEDANSVLTGFTISGGYAIDGAGINALNSSPTISYCNFTDNYATSDGGAIVTLNSDLLISHCIFRDNYASDDGGAIKFYYEKPVITNCIFTNNTAGSNGGALNLRSSEAIVRNCIFEGNSTETGSGGGLYNNGADAMISNCTFFNNTAAGTGGGMCHSGGCQVTNSIFWQNSALQSDQGGYFGPAFLAPTISFCDIEDSGGSGAGWDTTIGIDGGGNIDADPNFMDVADPNEPDLHLNPVSPCIDAGDPNGVYTGLLDIDGKLRLRGSGVDMGADEIPVTWYVDIDATGSADGFSLDSAFTTIQDGIDASVDEDTVLVTQGTYYESIDFKGKAITLQSTDPYDWDVVEATIIDANDPNSAAVTFGMDEDIKSILEGFKVTGGACGVYCDNEGSPLVNSCKIEGNIGDGLYCYDGSPSITNCQIDNNGKYGLRFVIGVANIINCVISENTTGGISGGSPIVTNCSIVSNNGYGISYCEGVIKNCILWDNEAELKNSLAQYSCIKDITGGVGNINYMPYFEDPNAGDYHLLSYSPCIDMGDTNSDYSSEPSGGGGRVNMGAYGNTAQAQLASADTDADGLPDSWELLFWPGDDPNEHDPNADPDSDGLDSLTEYQIGTNPNDIDTDEDLIGDGWEKKYGLDPLSSHDAQLDCDGDTLPNVWEYTYWPDDDPGIHGPADDPDGDNLSNLTEYQLGTDPTKDDTDADGMLDDWENANELNPLSSSDGQLDADEDDLNNADEYDAGTNPNNSDTDEDGMTDGWEVDNFLNPLTDDAAGNMDGDDYSNYVEFLHSSDPNDPGSALTNTTIVVPIEAASIQDGVDYSIDDDTVLILPGLYNESVDLGGKEITLTGKDPNDWKTVAGTIIDGDGQSQCIICQSGESSSSVITGLALVNSDDMPNANDGLVCSGASPTISRCIIESNGDNGIRVASGSPVIINNMIGNNAGDGINSTSSTVTIKNNWIYGNVDGIETTSDASGTVIRNNTVAYNSSIGIKASSDPNDSPPAISNCIVWQHNNDLANCLATYSCIEEGDTGVGNISSNPAFEFIDTYDSSNNIYSLLRTSPCIDAGDPNGTYTGENDIFNQVRQVGTVDMGADEVCIVHNKTQDIWYSSVQAAIDAADPNNTVEVYEWTFTENIDFDGKAITLTGTDPIDWRVVENTVIDANDPNNGVVTFDSGEGATSILTGLTLTGGEYGVYCDNNSSPHVTRCLIEYNANGVYCDSGSPLITQNKIHLNGGAGGAGLVSNSATPPTIKYNWIYDNDIGIKLTGATSAAWIQNNTITDNAEGGIYKVSGTAPDINSCVIWANDANDLIDCSAVYSCIEDVSDASGTGNITDDPLFIDMTNYNYHLPTSSPCHDAGDPAIDRSADYDIDNARIVSDTMGADNQLVWHVDGTNGSNGVQSPVSWNEAFKDLWYAMDEAKSLDPGSRPQEVWVAASADPYKPTVNPTYRNASFEMLSNVNLYGGFEPGASWSNRDPEIYATVLSGDLHNDDALDLTGGNLFWHNTRNDNCYSIVIMNSMVGCVLDGFIISGATNSGPDWQPGGGLLMKDCSNIIISNCTFTNNASPNGGAVHVENSSADLQTCSLAANCGGDRGGALFADYRSEISLFSCEVTDNMVDGEVSMGGGISVGGNLYCDGCYFAGNSSYGARDSWGGAIDGSSGTRVWNSTFDGNATEWWGGAICGPIDELVNCLFFDNHAIAGGAVCIEGGNLAIMTNCTLYDNQGSWEGGGVWCYAEDVQIRNCILWNNTHGSPAISDELAQIFYDPSYLPDVDNSCIEGLTGTLGGTSNIDDDPLFLSESTYDLQLKSGSPCLDEGDNTAVDEGENTPGGGITEDILGLPRIDERVEIVDMGAYESAYVIMPQVVVEGEELTEAEAILAIEAEGLIAEVIEEYHESIADDLVISQDVSYGTALPVGSTVGIVVSLGQPDIWFEAIDQEDNGKVEIAYKTYGDYEPRSIALIVTFENATISGSSAVDSKSAEYNCFIDYIHDNPDGYSLIVGDPDNGHPLANPSGPGEPVFTGGITQFTVNMAALNADQSAGPSGNGSFISILTLQLTEDSGNEDPVTISLDLDTSRSSLKDKARLPQNVTVFFSGP